MAASAPEHSSNGCSAIAAPPVARNALGRPESLASLNVTFARRFLTSEPTVPTTPGSMLRPSNLTTVGSYRSWCRRADAVGFPVGGMSMVLVLESDALAVFSATFFLGRPRRRVGAVGLSDIAQIATAKTLTKTHVVVLFDDGGIIEVQAPTKRRAIRFVEAVTTRLTA